MKRCWVGSAAIFVFLLSARPSLGADGPGDTHSLPCRPTIACTAELVAPGAFEVEAWLAHAGARPRIAR